MRSAGWPAAPDAPAAALPVPRPRPRTRCRASGRRSRTRPAAAPRAAPPAGSRREPPPPARMRRLPPELAPGLGVGGAAELGHRHRARLSRDEPRHADRLLADRSRRTCHKHPHHRPPDRRIIYTPYDKTAAPEVTPPSTQHGKRLLASTPVVSSEAAHKL